MNKRVDETHDLSGILQGKIAVWSESIGKKEEHELGYSLIGFL